VTSFLRRIRKLEATAEAMIQETNSKLADLSIWSLGELDVLEKVLDYTLPREAAAPTGKRPPLADPSGLSADDLVIYLRMVECAERGRDLREIAQRSERGWPDREMNIDENERTFARRLEDAGTLVGPSPNGGPGVSDRTGLRSSYRYQNITPA
jgi:hypothetical protein